MFLLLPSFVDALALALATYLVMAWNTHQIKRRWIAGEPKADR
jgi:hypothetical protein